MSKTTQSQKHATGLAGEFLVAGELLRRGILAAVTYGNAKKADVVAIYNGRSVALEVKSTSESKWVLGNHMPSDDRGLWVLVYLPPNLLGPPEYLVLTSAELRRAVLPRHDAYMASYKSKHGKEFSGKGVISVFRKEVDDQHLGRWDKVTRALKA